MEKKPLPQFQTLDPQSISSQLDATLKKNWENIESILQSPLPFNWENLMYPLEEAQNNIEQCWSRFSHLHAVNNTPEIRAGFERCLPLLTDYETKLAQHQPLYEAIRSISISHLTPTQRQIITHTLRDFELSGVHLPAAKKQRLQAIEEQLSELQTQFENHLIDAQLAFELHVTDPKRLEGLPKHTLHTAQSLAQAKQLSGWILGIDPPCYLAVMSNAKDRALRETLYHAYITRASDLGPHAGQFDNSMVMQKILKLRHEQAQLLGFPHFAALSLKTKMAKDIEEVFAFLHDLLEKTKTQAQLEFKALETFAQEHCQISQLQPWDLTFVSEQLKEQHFSFSEESLRPYFRESSVWQGLQMILHHLYGITLTEINEVDIWHPTVRCFQVFDEMKQLKGYLYVDLFARPYKRTGAWMDSLQTQMKTKGNTLQLPIATLTCNFAAPEAGSEATLLHEDVVTLFHELGHCLHHLLTRVTDYSASGMHGVEWDAVELPSQFFEHWCWDKTMLTHLTSSIHDQTSLPPPLIEQLLKTKTLHAGIALLRQLEFTLFDLRIHSMQPGQTADWIHAVLQEIRENTALLPATPDNRFEHSFSHIFAGGYAAGYYSYLWAEVLSSDCYSRFEKDGLLNSKTGRDFLHEILETGSSRPARENVEAFMGRKVSMEAFLRHRGIKAHP